MSDLNIWKKCFNLIKNSNNIIIMLIVIALFITTTNPLSNNSSAHSDKWYNKLLATDAYDYPVTPWKTPEIWKKIIPHNEMIEAVSIPDEILHSMSTAGLAETCINYPLIPDIVAYQDVYTGVKIVEKSFNGLQESYKRKDSAIAIKSLYDSIDINDLIKSEIFPEWRLDFIEFIILNDNLISSLAKNDQIDLLNKVIDNLHEREMAINQSIVELSSRALLIGRLANACLPEFMESIRNDEKSQEYIRTGMGRMSMERDEFIALVEKYLNKQMHDTDK